MYGNRIFFTRRQGQVQSRLDRFYVDSNIVTSSEYSRPGLSSDHDIVVLEIQSFCITPHGKGRWKNNAAIYETQAFKTELQFKWQQWLTLQSFLFDSKIEWWIHIKDRIKTLNIIHAKAKQTAERKQERFLIKQ